MDRPSVVYLDQFAFSLLAKAEAGDARHAAWLPVAGRLRQSVLKGIVVCPYSIDHQVDSGGKCALADRIRNLVYVLSGNSAFRDREVINRRQFERMLRAFDEQVEVSRTGCERSEGVKFDLGPIDRLVRFGGTWQVEESERVRLRGISDRTLRAWERVASEVTEGRPPNAEILGEQFVTGYAEDSLRAWLAWKQGVGQATHGTKDVEFVFQYFRGHPGFDGELVCRSTVDFMRSQYFRAIPNLRVGGLLSAAVVLKRRSGRHYHRNDNADINFIRWHVPYCDAMLVDAPMRALVTERHVLLDVRYGCRFFSARYLGAFLDWLERVDGSVGHAAAAPPQVRK